MTNIFLHIFRPPVTMTLRDVLGYDSIGSRIHHTISHNDTPGRPGL